jgi:hypothetical protein
LQPSIRAPACLVASVSVKVIIAAPVAMCIEEFFDHRAEHLSDFDDPCHQVLGVLAPGRFRPPLGYSEY